MDKDLKWTKRIQVIEMSVTISPGLLWMLDVLINIGEVCTKPCVFTSIRKKKRLKYGSRLYGHTTLNAPDLLWNMEVGLERARNGQSFLCRERRSQMRSATSSQSRILLPPLTFLLPFPLIWDLFHLQLWILREHCKWDVSPALLCVLWGWLRNTCNRFNPNELLPLVPCTAN